MHIVWWRQVPGMGLHWNTWKRNPWPGRELMCRCSGVESSTIHLPDEYVHIREYVYLILSLTVWLVHAANGVRSDWWKRVGSRVQVHSQIRVSVRRWARHLLCKSRWCNRSVLNMAADDKHTTNSLVWWIWCMEEVASILSAYCSLHFLILFAKRKLGHYIQSQL